DVTVTDEQGRTLLAAPKVTGSKTLLALLRDRSDPGEFTVEGPTAEVVCERGSTNLEDAIANYLKDETPPGPTRTPVVVRGTGGDPPAVHLDGTASARDLELAGPWLHGDRLKLASVELPLKLETVGRTVRVERAELKCDVGTLTAAGTFAPGASFDKLLDNHG